MSSKFPDVITNFFQMHVILHSNPTLVVLIFWEIANAQITKLKTENHKLEKQHPDLNQQITSLKLQLSEKETQLKHNVLGYNIQIQYLKKQKKLADAAREEKEKEVDKHLKRCNFLNLYYLQHMEFVFDFWVQRSFVEKLILQVDDSTLKQKFYNTNDVCDLEYDYFDIKCDGNQFMTNFGLVLGNKNHRHKDITTFPDAFLPKLESLKIYNTSITDVKFRPQHELTNLKELQLTYNKQLTRITFNSGMPNLEELDLGSNKLCEIYNLDQVSKKLTKLWVNDNCLSTLTTIGEHTKIGGRLEMPELVNIRADNNESLDSLDLSTCPKIHLVLVGGTAISKHAYGRVVINVKYAKELAYWPDRKILTNFGMFRFPDNNLLER